MTAVCVVRMKMYSTRARYSLGGGGGAVERWLSGFPCLFAHRDICIAGIPLSFLWIAIRAGLRTHAMVSASCGVTSWNVGVGLAAAQLGNTIIISGYWRRKKKKKKPRQQSDVVNGPLRARRPI